MAVSKKPTIQADLTTARHLAWQGSIQNAIIAPVNGAWVVLMEAPATHYILGTARGKERMFKTLEAAASAIHDIGIGEARIMLANWDRSQGNLEAVK